MTIKQFRCCCFLNASTPILISISLESFEFSPQVRYVLITKVPVLLQGSADYILKGNRHIGIELNGSYGIMVENRIRNQSDVIP